MNPISQLFYQLQPLLATKDVYDPATHWSCLEYAEQELLRTACMAIPEERLSVEAILRNTQVPLSPARIQYCKHLILQRFKRSTQ